MSPLRFPRFALLLAFAAGASPAAAADPLADPLAAETPATGPRFRVTASVLPAITAPAARYALREGNIEPAGIGTETVRFSLAGSGSKGAAVCAGTGTDAIFRNGFEN